MDNLGRGSNSGYGRLEIKDIGFEKVTLERKLGQETKDGRIAIVEDETSISQNELLQEGLDTWRVYN